MATKHRSVVYLKAMMPLLVEEEPDWDTIEELFVHASTHINNSLAAFRGSLKQSDLPFTNLSDSKPATPKVAEAVFACTFCGATGAPSEGDKHECDEGAWSAAFTRRCALCGGFVNHGDESNMDEGVELVHKRPCPGEPDPSVITDEAKQLPALVNCNAPNCEEMIESSKAGLCETHRIYPFVCLNCGDTFVSRPILEAHLVTTHHAAGLIHQSETFQVAMLICGSYHEVEVLEGIYSIDEIKRALRLPEESEVWVGLYDTAFDSCYLTERLTEKKSHEVKPWELFDGWPGTQIIKGDKTYQCEQCHDTFIGDDIAIVTELGPRCTDCKEKLEKSAEEPFKEETPSPANKYAMPRESRKALSDAVSGNEAKKKSKPKKTASPEVTH